MAMVIRPDDPMLVAIKAELLHGIPELTGKQINAAATLALIAIKRGNETDERKLDPTDPIEVARIYHKIHPM
jgi:hypothetical protein